MTQGEEQGIRSVIEADRDVLAFLNVHRQRCGPTAQLCAVVQPQTNGIVVLEAGHCSRCGDAFLASLLGCAPA